MRHDPDASPFLFTFPQKRFLCILGCWSVGFGSGFLYAEDPVSDAEATSVSEHLEKSGSLPGGREERIAYQKQLRSDLKLARKQHVALRQQIIDSSEELSQLQKDLQSMQQVEKFLVEDRPDIRELIKERDAKLEAYNTAQEALAEKQDELERLDPAAPEVNRLEQEVKKAVDQRQAAVNQLALNGKKRKVRVARLRSSRSDIQQIYKEWQEAKKMLDQKVEADPVYRESQEMLLDLQNQVTQLSRQIMGENR